MSNYTHTVFTPQQRAALERFGETDEAFNLDKWFTPQQIRIVEEWKMTHIEPKNANIFFNRLQCKYLDSLYKEPPSPLIPFEIGDIISSIVFRKDVSALAIPTTLNNIRIITGTNGTSIYIVRRGSINPENIQWSSDTGGSMLPYLATSTFGRTDGWLTSISTFVDKDNLSYTIVNGETHSGEITNIYTTDTIRNGYEFGKAIRE